MPAKTYMHHLGNKHSDRLELTSRPLFIHKQFSQMQTWAYAEMRTFRRTTLKLRRNTCKGVQLLCVAGTCVGIITQTVLLHVLPLITLHTYCPSCISCANIAIMNYVSNIINSCTTNSSIPTCKHKDLCKGTAARQHECTIISQTNAAAKAHCLSAALVGRSILCTLKQCRQVWEEELVAAPPLS